MDNTRNVLGKSGEDSTEAALRSNGFNVLRSLGGPFDLIVNGARVEIKTASPDRNMRWQVNLHRHGVLDESGVDIYIFSLSQIPGYGKRELRLIRRAPIGSKTVAYSIRSIFNQHREYIDNWEILRYLCQEIRANPNWIDPTTIPPRKPGRPAYGDYDGESEVIAIMSQARKDGSTLAQIKAQLEGMGKLSRQGKPWSLGAIHKVIKRISTIA